MRLPLLKEAEVGDKTVFLRADLDVPLAQPITYNLKPKTCIEDDTRLVAGLPTIEYLLKKQAVVIIGSKMGRPEGVDPRLSLAPVADWFAKKLSTLSSQLSAQKTELGQFAGWQITPKLFLLENLRFYKGEEGNDPAFAKQLALLAQIYVNDSFAVSHRTHASIVGVPQYLPHFAGLRLQKEVEVLSSVLQNPKRPLVVIIGGAKIETKLPVVSKMLKIADYVLVGGKIAGETEVLLKVAHQKTMGRKAALIIANLNIDGADITEKSLEKFLQIIDLAATIVWNGPMGEIDGIKKFSKGNQQGTRQLARKIAESDAYTVVGGGDTNGFLKKMGLLDKFSFVSTGGGAMLDFLSGEKLPGLEALLK